MLRSHPDRVCTFFSADFEPIIGFEAKLAGAVVAMQARFKAPHWGLGPGTYVLRDNLQRRILAIDFRRIHFSTLGLMPWEKNLEEHTEILKVGLQNLNVEQLKRIGFQTMAYLPIGMSHKEMVELMFGSFLTHALELQDVCGKPEDGLAQLHGEKDGMKTQVIVAPMTEAQSTQQVLQTPNLELFLEPKLLDAGVKEFKDRAVGECLYVSVDLSRTDIKAANVHLFPRQALDVADKITEAAVQKLKSLRVKKGR